MAHHTSWNPTNTNGKGAEAYSALPSDFSSYLTSWESIQKGFFCVHFKDNRSRPPSPTISASTEGKTAWNRLCFQLILKCIEIKRRSPPENEKREKKEKKAKLQTDGLVKGDVDAMGCFSQMPLGRFSSHIRTCSRGLLRTEVAKENIHRQSYNRRA